jgi:hypothetical protein
MDSLLCEAKVRSCQTRVTSKKASKFLSDSWIVLKFLQLIPEAVFLVVAIESLLDEEQVSWSQTSITAQKRLNF